MDYRQLGSSSLMCSPLGLGCMGMSEWYGPTNDRESLATLQLAMDIGVNFFDTADVYGNGHNELLLGKALKGVRERMVIASKFGFLPDEAGLDGRPEHVVKACEDSLQRLGTDYIDLYYLHRIDPRVPLEETIAAMSELVVQGKVRYLGLSEVSAESLKRASAVHPITALQTEYSVWVRDIEADILSQCRALDIAVVPYSPLGRGFLTGALQNADEFGEKDYRRDIPRFQADNFTANLAIVHVLQEIADSKGCQPAQVALAWLMARGKDVFPIPGTKRRRWLRQNVKSLKISLDAAELASIDRVSEKVKGQRKNAAGMALVDSTMK